MNVNIDIHLGTPIGGRASLIRGSWPESHMRPEFLSKFPVTAEKFPFPLNREFRCKPLNQPQNKHQDSEDGPHFREVPI